MMALPYPALAGAFDLAVFLPTGLASATFAVGFAALVGALLFAAAVALAGAFGLAALEGVAALAGLGVEALLLAFAGFFALLCSASISPAA